MASKALKLLPLSTLELCEPPFILHLLALSVYLVPIPHPNPTALLSPLHVFVYSVALCIQTASIDLLPSVRETNCHSSVKSQLGQ